MLKRYKYILLGLWLFFFAITSWGQTTIASDGLNNSTSLFSLTGGNYYSGNTGGGDAPASSPYASEGTHSRGVANGTATLTSIDINTTGYSTVEMTFRLASFSVGSTGNGADAGDIVTVEISPDGGTTYYSTLRVLGNSNARWSYAAGTGIATTPYDGNTTPVDFQPSGGGNRTTDGYSTVSITGLPSTSNLRIRVTLLNNDGNERWLVDDFKVLGYSAGCSAPTTQATASAATAITSTTSTLNWTRGSGNNILVVLRPTTASNVTPTNGTGYVPNTVYGSGATTGTNNFSVYTGTGTTVNITGLAPSTQYTMVVYEYNNTGICYLTSPISSHTFTTADPPPAVIALSSPSQIAAGNLMQGATHQPVMSFQAEVTVTNTILTSVGFVMGSGGGTYNAANLTNLRLYYNTTNSFATASHIGTQITSIPAAGAGATFTGLTQSINAGTTGYFWITASINSSATIGNTFNINANPTPRFSNGTPTGSISAGGNQTIIAAPSNETDVVAVVGSEATTISSIINTPGPLTSTQGTQVWQFTIREGGADLIDSDNYPSIVTHITLAQSAGNAVNTWNTAIQAVDLFDGSTHLASGVVTANQIQFSGNPIISVADGTSKTLSMRLTVKNPLPSDALDGDDFGFSLSNANITLSGTGSGKSSFSAQVSTNGQNAINVVATLLTITSQPSSAAVNNAIIPSVVFRAVDANGNLDRISSGMVTVFSTGTLSGSSTNTVTFISGVATFSNIIHSVAGNNFVLYTTNTLSLTNVTTTSFNILISTTFDVGDLAILAMNSNFGSNEEFSFIFFKDFITGTALEFTDNGYERQNIDQWGDTEGAITMVRTGATIPAGTVVTIEAFGNAEDAGDFNIYVGGVNDNANWTIGESTNMTAGAGFNMNSTDEIWFMQGGTWTNPVGSHNATYNGGNVLYGWTATNWDPRLTSSGSDRGTSASALYPGLDCFNTNVTGLTYNSKVKYTGPTTPASKITWILRLNNSANWTGYATDAEYTASGVNYKGGASYTITASGFVDGLWTGTRNNDWFDCGNWQSLLVPDATTDVIFDANATQKANIRYNSTLAGLYGSIAGCNNLLLSAQEINLEGSPLNKLHIRGNLSITGTGTLDISDGTGGTPDGSLTINGSWLNARSETEFKQGESTVYFNPTGTQTIQNTNSNRETFYNIVHMSTGTMMSMIPLILEGNLSISGNGTLDMGTWIITGIGLNMAAGSTLRLAHSTTGANFVPSFSGFTLNSTSTIEFYSSDNQNILSSPTYGNVLFANAGLKTVSGSILNLTGNLTNNGGYLPRFETISITGANKSITGTAGNMVVSTLGIGASSTIYTNTVKTILSTITIGNNSTLHIIGQALTLKSTPTQTARIGQSGTNATISGFVVAERYLPGIATRQNITYQIAPSVNGGIVRDWQGSSSTTGIYITGGFGGKSNPGAWTGISPNAGASMYIYRATTPADYEAYPPRTIGSNHYVLTPGVGYRNFVRDGTTAAGFNSVVPKVLTIVGFPLFGTFNFSIATNTGWNFLGNPYHCEITGNLQDATAWSRTGIGAALYLWNSTASSFNTYVDGVALFQGSISGWNGRIPSSQAFWVKATTTGASLSVNENAKKTDQSAIWRSEVLSKVLNVILQNSNESDGVVIRYDIESSHGFDGEKDAEKLPAEFIGAAYTSIHVVANDGLKYTVQTVPLPETSKTDTFELYTKVKINTPSQLIFNGLNTFDSGYVFKLYDAFTPDTLYDLKQGMHYAYFAGTDTVSSKNTRFKIIVNYTKTEKQTSEPMVTIPSQIVVQKGSTITGIAGLIGGCEYSIYPNPMIDKYLHVDFDNCKNVDRFLYIYSSEGRHIHHQAISTGKNVVYIKNNLSQGIYHIKIIQNDDIVDHKLAVK